MAEVQEIEQEVGELETVVEEIQQQEAKPAEEDDLPDEFKGKSIKDLVGITLHARKEMGRQANELGEIRKLADELIKSHLKPKEQEVEQPKEVDFFENPQEAIRRAVESNPKVQAAEQYALNAQRAAALQQVQSMHPDMNQIVADPEFIQWVGNSPVRQNLLKQADQEYDVSAAHELFSTFKELRNARKQNLQKQVINEIEKTSRAKDLQSAAVDSGGSGETSRKVYRRADLIKLKMTDPARYEAMNDEILAAYSEGRVR